jgi:hypothetical protein
MKHVTPGADPLRLTGTMTKIRVGVRLRLQLQGRSTSDSRASAPKQKNRRNVILPGVAAVLLFFHLGLVLPLRSRKIDRLATQFLSGLRGIMRFTVQRGELLIECLSGDGQCLRDLRLFPLNFFINKQIFTSISCFLAVFFSGFNPRADIFGQVIIVDDGSTAFNITMFHDIFQLRTLPG